MKRSTKKWMIAAGCLVAAGALFWLIGGCMGGYHMVREWALDGELSWDFGWGFRGGFFREDHVAFSSDAPVYEGDVDQTQVPDAAGIDRVSFDTAGSTVRLKYSDDGNYYFAGENAGKFQCFAHNGTLSVRAKGRSGVGSRQCVITVWVPENAYFREIELTVGGGSVEADALSGDDISLDVGGGTIELGALSGKEIRIDLGAGECLFGSIDSELIGVDIGAGEMRCDEIRAQELSVSIGAGQATVSGGEVKDVDISVGAGQVNYAGAVTGDLDVECSMGAVYLELAGEEKDHNYDISCSMGSVTVGDDSFGGMGVSREIDNGSESEVTLDCSMGEIAVTFR